MFTTKFATVEKEIGSKGFGFVSVLHNDIEISIFVHETRLFARGFTWADFKKEARVALSYSPQSGGRYCAENILQIEDKKSVVPVMIDNFANARVSGDNPDKNEVAWRIETKDGQFVQYIVTNKAGLVIRQLGRMTSNDARANIGILPKPPARATGRKARLEKMFQVAVE